MKLKFILILLASTLMAGCSKCSQQSTSEAPTEVLSPAPAEPAEPAAVEGGSALGAEGQGERLPDVDKMKEDLPEGE